MIRVDTPLHEGVEALVHDTIGCCIRVHRELGPGLLERIYARAVCIELAYANIRFESEKSIPILYRGELVARQRLDIVVADVLVLEIKAVDRLAPVHHAQVLSYLRASKCRVGLLMNFNEARLPEGMKRIILQPSLAAIHVECRFVLSCFRGLVFFRGFRRPVISGPL